MTPPTPNEPTPDEPGGHQTGTSGPGPDVAMRLRKLEETADLVQSLLDRVADLELPPPDTELPPPDAPEGPPTLDMPLLVGWVQENIAHVIERRIATQATSPPYWCRRWWLHPEAILRFEATRRVWLASCTEAVGDPMSAYLQHLDHHLGVLQGSGGPFCRCRPDRHTDDPLSTRRLGQDEPPESFYTGEVPAPPILAPATTAGHDGAPRPTPYPRAGSGTPSPSGGGPVRGVDQHRVARGRGW